MDIEKELAYLFSNPVGGDFGLLEDAEKIAEAPNFFIPKEDLASIVEGKAPARCLAERAVAEIYRRIVSDVLEEKGLTGEFAGAEWWCQVYKRTQHSLSFHFDADTEKQKEGVMSNPLFSSVLYLTGTAGRDPSSDAAAAASAAVKRALRFGWREGATAITNQIFDQTQRKPLPDPPTRLVLVFPEQGNFVLFDGRLGHGVLDSSLMSQRTTFLINFWKERPRAIERVTEGQVQEFGLSPDPGPLSEGVKIGRTAIPSLRLAPVPEPTESEEGVVSHVTIRGLLEGQGVRLTGKGAVSAVSIDHAGFVLYPVDREQASEVGGIGAVFVPESEMVGVGEPDSE